MNKYFSESTHYFTPGVHDFGRDFQEYANKCWYIPGDAVVYGTMNNSEYRPGCSKAISSH